LRERLSYARNANFTKEATAGNFADSEAGVDPAGLMFKEGHYE